MDKTNRLAVEQTLPKFVPYERLKVGNNIIGSRFLVNFSGFIPLIIGKGRTPKVWIYYRENGVAIPLIEDNQRKTPQISYACDERNKSFAFYILDMDKKEWLPLIHIIYGGKIPIVSGLDLRPLGVNVYLEGDTLCAGSVRLNGSTMIGAEALIRTE